MCSKDVYMNGNLQLVITMTLTFNDDFLSNKIQESKKSFVEIRTRNTGNQSANCPENRYQRKDNIYAINILKFGKKVFVT